MISTLRARLSLWYLATLAVSLLVFATLLYWALDRSLHAHHDDELLREARGLTARLERERGDRRGMDGQIGRFEFEGVAPFVLIRDRSGRITHRSSQSRELWPAAALDEAVAHVGPAPGDGPVFVTVHSAHGDVRFVSIAITPSRSSDLLVGKELGDLDETLGSVWLTSLVLVPVVLVLTSFGGAFIAGRALAPIESMNDTLRTIQATDLGRRIDATPRDAELSGLVTAVNRLLHRLELAFTSLREFAADSSHQLQTPLAVMKGWADVALSSSRTEAEYRDALARIADEVTQISVVVEDLRTLSLADLPAAGAATALVNLSDIWREGVEIVTALGEPAGVTVSAQIEDGLQTRGNAVGLKQILLNLGENAVQYTPRGGRVTIGASRREDGMLLRVSDTGTGVAAEHLPHLFERFYRVERNGRGTGLGLAIVSRVVESHGGTIDVQSRVGQGSTFDVRLPAAAPERAPDG